MAPPRDAAIALVWRPGPRGRELLWLRRGAKLSFGAGFYAFPGGKLDPQDAAVPVEGASGEDAALRVCAVRECFEETGLLLARGADRLPAQGRAELRAALEGGKPFAELVERARLSIAAEDLVAAGRWVTPDLFPIRFDARMFLAQAPEGQSVELSQAETSDGGFITPTEALGRWKIGAALLHPPNWNALVALSEPDSPEGWARALERLRNPPLTTSHITSRIEFQEGVVLVPQRTPTLPPATHTNAFLLGFSEMTLVDPGAEDDLELYALYKVIDALAAEGRKLRSIALTHHHIDHIGGVAKVQKRFGLPVWAHALTEPLLAEAGIKVDRRLTDGEELGLAGFPLTAIHTPGHTRGHLSFWHAPSGSAMVGDLMSSLSTIVIDPPEGNMIAYLASLQRMLGLRTATLYPAHGPIVTDAEKKLRELQAHRLLREGLVLDAVKAGADTLVTIVQKAYSDTPAFLHPLAERSALAHLEKLVVEGKVVARGERYAAA